jgi:3-hydroxyacyl-CoA dehydrogenase
MKLIEIISAQETSKETYKKLKKWGQGLGKVTVTWKDTIRGSLWID